MSYGTAVAISLAIAFSFIAGVEIGRQSNR